MFQRVIIYTKSFTSRFHSSLRCYNENEKKLLMNLRKKTGYAFNKCKKALLLNNNDEEKAEIWLNEQATLEGWDKANKLQSSNKQGLIGMMLKKNKAVIVEVNCETDFVSKNNKFHSLVVEVTKSLMEFDASNLNDKYSTTFYNKEQLNSISINEGMCLGDYVARNITQIGENIYLSRGASYSCSDDTVISGSIHPQNHLMSLTNISPLTGRFGALVVFECKQHDDDIGFKLSQHIIEMGDINEFMEKQNELLKLQAATAESNELWERDYEESEDSDYGIKNSLQRKKENRLLFQEYLFDSEKLVGHFLLEHNCHLLDYIRFAIGEN